MATPLLQQFPSLAAYSPAFLKDFLSSPELTEAFLFSLPEIQQLAAEVEQLGKENENMARESLLRITVNAIRSHRIMESGADRLGRNMELRDELLALRENTAMSYGHAEALKAQWQEIDKAQAQLYQVS